MDIDLEWGGIDKPSGWAYPAEYTKSRESGEAEAVKKMYAELSLDNVMLKDVLSKKPPRPGGKPCCQKKDGWVFTRLLSNQHPESVFIDSILPLNVVLRIT